MFNRLQPCNHFKKPHVPLIYHNLSLKQFGSINGMNFALLTVYLNLMLKNIALKIELNFVMWDQW